MRILIISDVHSNYEALEAVLNDEKFDHLFFLGDVVDYGPSPLECIKTIKKITKFIVTGNHDKSLSTGIECGCSEKYRALSGASRANNLKLIDESNKNFLRNLPLKIEINLNGYNFFLTHASPQGDIYKYVTPDLSDEMLKDEIKDITADFIFIGHTHLPMMKNINNQIIINPGSVGQPRDGINTASYCIWEDGKIFFKRKKYDLNITCKKILESDLDKKFANTLADILKHGKLPNI